MSEVGSDYVLNNEDIPLLLECLLPISNRCEELAIVLKLYDSTREYCRSRRNIEYLYNILIRWVDGEGLKPVTLGQLAKALASPILGRERLAGTLISKFNEELINTAQRSYSASSQAGDPKASPGYAQTPEETGFFSDVTAAIIDKLSIERIVVNILLKGLPGAGKTSLLDRLLNKPIRLDRPSTGICDGSVIVEIGASSEHTSAYTCKDDTWQVTDFNESVVSQLDNYKAFITKEVSPSGRNTTHPQLDIGQLISDTECHVKELLSKHNIENIADLSRKSSIYIRDTGGQIEFQECLSLLIFGPSLFIFVIRTDVDILTKNKIQYRSSSGEIINQYESSISAMDALIQFLTSVSAIQTTEEGVLQAGDTSVCHEPVVFIVGTHIDKLGSKAQSVLTDINKTLYEMIRKRNFSPFIRYADIRLKKVLYEVDNTSKDDHSFQHFRSHINQYIRERREFLVEYPVSYLLFCLELQNIKEAVIPMEKWKKLASKFCIEDKEIGSLLHFLQFRVGIIQHYNVQGISDLIIKEPQVLFNKVTELILKTFLTSMCISSTQQERFCQKGILEASAFEKLLNKEDQITPYQFLLFLTNLRIAVPITNRRGIMQYFIPSVLNHAPKSPSDMVNTDIAPLFITFQLGHCPEGLFGMLISYLLDPEYNQELTFDLLEDNIYQDQVSLLVSSLKHVDEICLKSHITHLEVNIDFENYSTQNSSELYAPRESTPDEVCNSIRLILDQCLQLSLKKLHYNCDKVGIGFSLQCPQKCGQLHEVKEEPKPCYMRCSTPRNKLTVPKSGGPWFSGGNVMLETLPETEVDIASKSSKSFAGIATTDRSLSSPSASSSNGSSSTSAPCASSDAAENSQIPKFSLAHLTLLKWTDEYGQSQTLRLRDEMSFKWQDVGILLTLGPSRIRGIDKQYREDVRRCCQEVFIDWIQDDCCPQYPATWKGLLNLLVDLELSSCVAPLKSALKLS